MRMDRIARGGALAVLLAAGVLAANQGVEAQRQAGAQASGYRPETVECQALKAMNAFRRQHGKEPLTLSPTLGAAAVHHSEDMARKNYFSHNLQGGPTWIKNIRQHGYRDFPVGENIAAGMESAQGVITSWIHSPPHRKAMLNGDYHAVGLGRAFGSGSEYGYYWTADFGGPVDQEIPCR